MIIGKLATASMGARAEEKSKKAPQGGTEEATEDMTEGTKAAWDASLEGVTTAMKGMAGKAVGGTVETTVEGTEAVVETDQEHPVANNET